MDTWSTIFEGYKVYSVQQTSDGGYILAGEESCSGGGFWLVKTDSKGNKEWDKTFEVGGSCGGFSVQQTTDGGYIIAGCTVSINTYDYNDFDIWLAKTDINGNKQWNKTFVVGNNNGYDLARSVQQTSDSGYILAGYSNTGGIYGGDHYAWLIKTDSNGNKQWDKTFEGNDDDWAKSVKQTTDGGYIIVGYTVTGPFDSGDRDAWLIKTDSNGNKQWDKTFGGKDFDWAHSIQQTTDGGYIFAGDTSSYGAGGRDVWILDAWLVKTDSNGNKEWDKTFGGDASDSAESVQQTTDGGYIFAGSTSSYGAGDSDVWLVKTDSNGNKQWDKTFEISIPTTPSQQNKSSKTIFIFSGAAILISFVLLAGKFHRKEQGTSRPTLPTLKPTLSPVSHATQEAADLDQKQMEMQRLAELRNDASRKLNIAKSMLNQTAQLGIDTSQLEDILTKAEQAFQKENYTHTIDYVKNYLALIDQAEKNKKQLEQMRKSASEKIKSAKFSIEKAERIGVTVQHARELKTKAQSAFDANDYNSAIRFANKSRDTAEQLINKSKPSISIELPPKMEYDAWKRWDLIVANEGTAHAVAITITFLTALEVKEFKVIKRLDVHKKKIINVNMKPTEKGEVPVDYSIEFKDLMDRVYKTEDTATIQISTGIETAWESTTSPSEKVKTDSNKLVVLREDEFFNGFIRLKISVQNKMQLTATDVFLDIDHDENVLRFDHHEPDTYATKKEKIQLGNISSNSDRTITLYFEGLICSKGGEINCRIDYKDAYGKPDSVRMEPLKIPIVCPIFKTEQDINIGRLKELVSSLPAQSTKVFLLPSGVSINKALTLCREVIQMHDVRHVRTFKTTDNTTYETWYYGKTKVEMINLVIKASVNKKTERIEVFVAAPDQKNIIGLLAELGRNLSKRGEALGKLAPVFNVSIKDSQIVRSNLLSACDINGICDGNVVIEDSWVQRSNIASNANNISTQIKDSVVVRSTIGAGTKKCPNCGREVEANEKFCLECGAKLGGNA